MFVERVWRPDGVREPVALDIQSDGDRREVEEYVRTFPLTTNGIVEYLDLRRPIYRATAAYGHFGSGDFPWENVAKVQIASGARAYKKEAFCTS